MALRAGQTLSEALPGGGELLMIAGNATEGRDHLAAGSWLRIPPGDTLSLVAGDAGAKIWIKTGHLPFAAAPNASRY